MFQLFQRPTCPLLRDSSDVFNNLGATFTLFNRELEIPQIQTGNWNRILILNDADICLTKVKEPSMLCLWIKLKQPVSTQS